MWHCVICHFELPLDDVVVRHSDSCICLRCYGRETGSRLTMSKELRRELIAALCQL